MKPVSFRLALRTPARMHRRTPSVELFRQFQYLTSPTDVAGLAAEQLPPGTLVDGELVLGWLRAGVLRAAAADRAGGHPAACSSAGPRSGSVRCSCRSPDPESVRHPIRSGRTKRHREPQMPQEIIYNRDRPQTRIEHGPIRLPGRATEHRTHAPAHPHGRQHRTVFRQGPGKVSYTPNGACSYASARQLTDPTETQVHRISRSCGRRDRRNPPRTRTARPRPGFSGQEGLH